MTEEVATGDHSHVTLSAGCSLALLLVALAVAAPTAGLTASSTPCRTATPCPAAAPLSADRTSTRICGIDTSGPADWCTCRCAPAPPAPACIGDCSGDGVLSVDEIIAGVNLALARAAGRPCEGWDPDGDGEVTIADLLEAIGAALQGCRARAPTPTPTATPPPTTPLSTPTGTPTTVVPDAIARLFDAICSPAEHPFRRITADGAFYSLRCELPGHYADVGLRAYPSQTHAESAFAAAAQAGEPYEFHGLPAAYWEMPFPSLGGAHRNLVWRLGCWVISLHSFDDTIYRLAPQVVPVSEQILADAGGFLLDRCPGPPPTPVVAPDLVPSGIDASYSGGTGCGPFGSLNVCVTNAGNAAAAAFSVSVDPGVALAFDPLPAGARRCSSQPLPDIVSSFTVRVDPDDRIDELDEDNNLLAASVSRPTVPRTCSPTVTRTPTPTPTRTPSCAATGTPYCADRCVPCPTVRSFCYRSACGRCFENPRCAPGEVLSRGSGSYCGACVTPTPTPASPRTPPSVAPAS